jgi:hypothetical protein
MQHHEQNTIDFLRPGRSMTTETRIDYALIDLSRARARLVLGFACEEAPTVKEEMKSESNIKTVYKLAFCIVPFSPRNTSSKQ